MILPKVDITREAHTVRSAQAIVRFLALPMAMAAFIMAAQISGGLVLRTAPPSQIASLR